MTDTGLEWMQCECGYDSATDFLDDGRRVCLDCSNLWDYAMNYLGVDGVEFDGIPHNDRSHFLSERLERAILSRTFDISSEGGRKVRKMFGDINDRRNRADLSPTDA